MHPLTVRGREAITITTAMLDWVDRNLKPDRFFSKIDPANRRVAWFVRQIGFNYAGRMTAVDGRVLDYFDRHLIC
ncbi:hypothetical protein [Flavisphingomonas formosensis]|uniref:hypothetical protein n=1 Tax=Flavisphingomonas formosensis TaxID=861534 RepID=UPI0012FCC020|nr:hypothetical protein [Sphingomonas formosensis]